MMFDFLKVKLYAKHMEKSPEQIEADIQRPKYFSPSEAVEYGIIDKVVAIRNFGFCHLFYLKIKLTVFFAGYIQ